MGESSVIQHVGGDVEGEPIKQTHKWRAVENESQSNLGGGIMEGGKWRTNGEERDIKEEASRKRHHGRGRAE